MIAPPVPIALEQLRVKSDRRLVRAILLIILVPDAFFAGIDLLGIRPGTTSLESRVLARALSLGLPLMGLWLMRGAHTFQSLSNRVLATALTAVPVLIVLQLQQPRGSTLVLATLLLILVAMYGALPNTPVRQALPPILLSVFVVGARIWWLNGPSDAGLGDDLVVILFVNVIGVIAVRRRNLLQSQVSESWRQQAEAFERQLEAERRAERATRDLRALRGIIPICASCKQVRTDGGEWQRIERYVREHSDAEFSHGVCPTCAIKLYGDILAEPAPHASLTT